MTALRAMPAFFGNGPDDDGPSESERIAEELVDPLLMLAQVRPLALTFRRATTADERFLTRFDSYKYGQARRAAMRRVSLPGAKQ